MICPHCQKPNRDQRRFCGDCGTSLTQKCTSCDFVNEAVDRFCGGCGLATQMHVEAAAPMGDAGVPMLSAAELQALLTEVPAATAPVVTLPQGPIGQDDLDRLFGGVP